ncbi:MAG: DUF479 domain-containing protein [Marinilabiliales bacterium]|nr:MAG: DUF479 domain-containing protein [Marinilabiliales bacterium]
MNYLMHYMLSGDDEDIIIGNYIADHIRGAATINALPNSIKKGILLHRVIDRYSDMHPAVKNSVSLLLPHLYHYAHVSVDIIYDHFLVKHWQKFCKKPLEQRMTEFYSLLEERFETLPIKSQKITRKLIDNDWFRMYETLEGMQKVFNGMSKRASFKSNMEYTVNYLKQYYNEFDKDFLLFTHDMVRFIKLHKRYDD